MKRAINKTSGKIFLSVLAVLAAAVSLSAQVFNYSAAGANPAAIDGTVNEFRRQLGGANNGAGGSYTRGRREISWDDVPDGSAAPFFLRNNYFNSTSQRGVVFSSAATLNDSLSFMVSADSSNPTSSPVRFGDIDPRYPSMFQTYSSERLFAANNSNIIDINFFIPGTNVPATVQGFGAVFADVDYTGSTYIKVFDDRGNTLYQQAVLPANNGLSFVGLVSSADRFARVQIICGTAPLLAGVIDSGNTDVVAMDDFIYGEPRARDFHSGDFDGDGFTDTNIFRPSNGNWYILNSGSNTVTIGQWGLNGDIPIDGDFDGDRRADVAIFRPSNGQWWFRRSSDETTFAVAFGQAGDKPVAGDYDQDGKTDIALWRPSNGNYYILRSTGNFSSYYSYPFGLNGDIPVQGGAQ